MDTVVVYKDKAGEWRWRRVASNGETIADSSEGYVDKDFCLEMAEHVNKDPYRSEVDD